MWDGGIRFACGCMLSWLCENAVYYINIIRNPFNLASATRNNGLRLMCLVSGTFL